METARHARPAIVEPVQVTNRGGSQPVRPRLRPRLQFPSRGISARSASTAAELSRHIAWDPGALPVAERMADALDAPLVESRISRLVIDCNRPLDAPDLIPAVSETTDDSRQYRPVAQASAPARIARRRTPFHDAIDSVIAERLARRARDVARLGPFLHAGLQGRCRGPGRSASSMTTTSASPRR